MFLLFIFSFLVQFALLSLEQDCSEFEIPNNQGILSITETVYLEEEKTVLFRYESGNFENLEIEIEIMGSKEHDDCYFNSQNEINEGWVDSVYLSKDDVCKRVVSKKFDINEWTKCSGVKKETLDEEFSVFETITLFRSTTKRTVFMGFFQEVKENKEETLEVIIQNEIHIPCTDSVNCTLVGDAKTIKISTYIFGISLIGFGILLICFAFSMCIMIMIIVLKCKKQKKNVECKLDFSQEEKQDKMEEPEKYK